MRVVCQPVREGAEYKAAWIEVCADYLQMCVEAKAAYGKLLPCLENEFVTDDMYMGETPDRADTLKRLSLNRQRQTRLK
jgi:hypothetical protein